MINTYYGNVKSVRPAVLKDRRVQSLYKLELSGTKSNHEYQ